MEITECTVDTWMQAEETWLERLKDEELWNKVPLLNVNELHNLRDATLVRFRGMVQDMRGDQEFYLKEYELYNKTTKETTKRCGKYRDSFNTKPEEVLVEVPSARSIYGERQTMVVVSDPALNNWVKDIEADQFKMENMSSPQKNQNKRNLPEDEPMETECSSEQSKPSTSNIDVKTKKQCTTQATQKTTNSTVSTEYLLNLPIPERGGKVCQVKIYNKEKDTIRLNEYYEFIGFLSVEPQEPLNLEGNETEELMEIQTHYPPSSLIPRLHCVTFKKLRHCNPLIEGRGLTVEKMKYLRGELLIVLTQLLLGDAVAAEYLLSHLISEIYLRSTMLSLGKFSVNLSNVPVFNEIDYVKEIYKFIELLVTKSHYLPMTLENMNTIAFTPCIDQVGNRLTSGLLQLTANTHLILDETKLTEGRLDASGLKSVKTLATVIKNQKLMYDFGVYSLEFDSDIPFLTFSEGKSMLPTDCHVVLQPDNSHVDTFQEILEAAEHFLKPELLNDIRKYLTLARMVEYDDISVEFQQVIEKDFVAMRQKDQSITGDDLHNLLVLSRLICISYGKSKLDGECWKQACDLEGQRKARIKK